MMKGWKTWVAVIGTAAFAVVQFVQGHNDEGMKLILAAAGLLGIGHKLDKAGE